MADWEVTVGEYGYAKQFNVVDSAGAAFNLTGYTVTLKVWSDSTSLFTGTCDLDADPTTGICYYTPISTDFSATGKYYWRLELTKAGVERAIPTEPQTLYIWDDAP